MSYQDPFERDLAEQLSELADRHRPPQRSVEQVAAAAMSTRASRWPAVVLAIGVAIGTLAAVAVLGRERPEQGLPSAHSSPSVVESSSLTDPASYRYSCGPGHSFSATLVDGAAVDPEQMPSASEALTRYLEGGSNEDLLTADGWHLAGLEDRNATLISSVAYAPGGGEPYYRNAYLELEAGRWRARNYGGCQPRIDVEGFGPTEWWPDADAPLLPTTTSFLVSVTERSCTSGASSEDRLRPPIIVYEADRIFVTFLVEPLPPRSYACIVNPSTEVRIELTEPIGDRELVDGGTLPWRDIRSGSVYCCEGAKLTPEEVTAQVVAVLQANKDANAPEFDDVDIQVLTASVMTLEDAWYALQGTATSGPDRERTVWLVRARGPFVSLRGGRGADRLVGTSGYFLIDDRTGDRIGMGFQTEQD